VAKVKVLSQYLPGETEESHENPVSIVVFGPSIDQERPEYEAGVLTTRPQCLSKFNRRNICRH
jgi:hypothetical protein